MNKLAIVAAGTLLLISSACGTSAAAPQPAPASTAPVAATLPAAATLPPAPATVASAPVTSPGTSAAATPSAGSDLLARGKKVYETAGEVGCTDCHGPTGRGGVTKVGDSAPDIRGATEEKLRAALGGGAALMSYIKLTDSEIDAVVAYLKYLQQQ